MFFSFPFSFHLLNSNYRINVPFSSSRYGISRAPGQRQVKVYPILVETLLRGEKPFILGKCGSLSHEAKMPVLLKRVEISRWVSVKSEFRSWILGPWIWAVQGTPHSLGDHVPQEPVLCHCSLLLATGCCNEQKWCCGTLVVITPWEEDAGGCDPLWPSAALTPGDCTGTASAAPSPSPFPPCARGGLIISPCHPFPGRIQCSPFKAYF